MSMFSKKWILFFTENIFCWKRYTICSRFVYYYHLHFLLKKIANISNGNLVIKKCSAEIYTCQNKNSYRQVLLILSTWQPSMMKFSQEGGTKRRVWIKNFESDVCLTLRKCHRTQTTVPWCFLLLGCWQGY